ncbi:DUF983 domain-containing protein [Flavobacteriaceae bacterium 144Ye]|jgi:uncharacterized protein (DUF983 family)|uniref:Uncharacterized protein DUF983 n=1 Tax=Meridianimaribacter flavus TaxID=571115 RepID=A0ABY2G500_9FLAO|nr:MULTISPECIES: DUF983 domain-containing protein [Flavobacteriaceae]RYH74011.1 DUF983 domain-containing protein [Flavobacteriaceae bacterium 144Ye]TBV25996.1 DUF983 domain-containing protein [Meridianimaribacter sp. CL38]TDY11372.1 uncharacterized protein DUF983 [Meridianimaribacter flavus]
MRNVIAALTCKCPKCKNGKIFNNRGNLLLLNIPKMNDKCPVCNYKFERETGFFFGAMFVSYGLAVAQMIASLVVFWYFIDLSPLRVFAIIATIAVLLGTINFKLSRSIWIYIFYKDKV